MITSDLLQSLVATGGILLGVIYVFGGTIVTLHLNKYGITEFQLLRSAYLSAGILYLILSIPCAGLAVMIVRLANDSFAGVESLEDTLAILSLSAGFLLVFATGGKKAILKNFNQELAVFMALATLSNMFPVYMFTQYTPALSQGVPASLDTGILAAMLILLFAIFAQLLFFGVYIHSTFFGKSEIRFSLSMEASEHFSRMNLPVADGVAGPFLLIDETESMYILGLKLEDKIQPIKVAKDLVKVVAY